MKELKGLVKLIVESKPKSGDLLSFVIGSGTQMRKLYDGLSFGFIESNTDALKSIPEIKTLNRLASVKSKLKERLEDVILIIGSGESDTSDRQQAYITCSKKWSTIRILLAKNARQNAIPKLEQLLRYSKRFEFTEITLDVLRALAMNASIFSGNTRDFENYSRQIEVYEEVRLMENRTEHLYSKLTIEFVNSKSDKLLMAARSEQYYKEVEPYLKKCQSYKVQLFGRLLQISIYDNRNDYVSMASYCKDAIEFFEEKNYTSQNAIQVFYYSLLMSQFDQRAFSDCRFTARKYESFFAKGSFNWFKWLELSFLTEMHSGNYANAQQIWLKVHAAPQYIDLPDRLSETWKIYEAFLFFLGITGKVKLEIPIVYFKLSRFSNEFHVFSRDKSGMNIPILIIKFLINLASGNFDKCIDREESLAKYRTRYLTLKEAGRSHYFFKILETVAKVSFNLKEVDSKVLQLFEAIQDLPIQAANQNHEVEIIPYEDLWKICRQLLTRNMAANA